jgi:hypothetical protein
MWYWSLPNSQAFERVIAPLRIEPPASIDQQNLNVGQTKLLGAQTTGDYWVVVVLVVLWVVATEPDGVTVAPFVVVWVLSVCTPLLSVVC